MEIIVLSMEEVWPDIQPKSAAITLHTACDLTTQKPIQTRENSVIASHIR